MELPVELKGLYRHWPQHATAAKEPISASEIFDDEKLFENISTFVHERIGIWERKTNGALPPYTADKILSTYRFCNIFREFDKQTIEFHTLLNPLRDDFALWLLNMFYCRMVARPETIRSVGLLSFNQKENDELYDRLRESSRPRYGTPYVFPISTIMRSNTPTRELFIARYLPSAMKKIAGEIEQWEKISVYEGVRKVLPIFGYNLEFLWTEVLIDVAYQYPERIDLFARFPIGPGSLPTMKRINKGLDPTELVTKLARVTFNTGITYKKRPLRLSAENWEGIGCEFRKYTNLLEGRGRKRRFR